MVGTRADSAIDDRLERLIRPRSIAVFGASATRNASGNQAITNLRNAGYTGTISVYHPAGGVIDGIAAVDQISDLPADTDVALLSIPREALVPALRELEALGVPGAVIGTAGLSVEQSAGLRAFCSAANIRVNGPNCMGLLNVVDATPMWFYEGLLTDLTPGSAALVTQSGSAAFLTRATEGVGFSRVISSGNEFGVDTADYLKWLAQDDATTAIGVVMESIHDVEAFTDAVAICRRAAKPVVVLKVGRTAAGAAASVAHTGAVVGSSDAYRALFERLDVPVVNDYDELAVALSYLASPRGIAGRSSRSAVITDSGGQAALIADLASSQGVDFPQFEEATLEKLRAILPGMEPRNPLDVGGSPGAPANAYELVLPVVAADGNIDNIALLVEALEAMSDQEVEYATEMFEAARGVADASRDKPVVVASPTSASVSNEVRRIVGPNVPILRGLANSVSTLRVIAGNQRDIAPAPVRPTGVPTVEALSSLKSEVVAAGAGPLPADIQSRLLEAYAIPFVASCVVTDAAAGQAWADGRYPVVVKVSSADVPHRSDVGGVVTDVAGPDELAQACKQIEESVGAAVPHAVISGFEIQEQVTTADEVLVGFVNDPAIGPVVTIGTGGVFVELIGDVAVGLAPLRDGEGQALLKRTRLSKVLDGYRRQGAATDTTELLEVLDRCAWLAADFAGVLVEADFNPVLVEQGTGRVRLVDALVVAAAVEGA